MADVPANERVLAAESIPGSALEDASMASGLSPEYLNTLHDKSDPEYHQHEHSYGGSQTPSGPGHGGHEV